MNQRQPLGCSPQHTPQLAQRFALPWHLEPRARWGPWHPATTDGVTYLQLAQRGTCREAATFLSLLFLLSAGEKKKKKAQEGTSRDICFLPSPWRYLAIFPLISMQGGKRGGMFIPASCTLPAPAPACHPAGVTGGCCGRQPEPLGAALLFRPS